MSRCPKCKEPWQEGAIHCLFCDYTKKGAKEDRSNEYNALPPCYRCAGTGIVASGPTGYAACTCQRGQWMLRNGEVFRDIGPDPLGHGRDTSNGGSGSVGSGPSDRRGGRLQIPNPENATPSEVRDFVLGSGPQGVRSQDGVRPADEGRGAGLDGEHQGQHGGGFVRVGDDSAEAGPGPDPQPSEGQPREGEPHESGSV